MEKFQISVKNLNNLWSFIEIYAVFVLYLCGEKSVWRKNDKYEVCRIPVRVGHDRIDQAVNVEKAVVAVEYLWHSKGINLKTCILKVVVVVVYCLKY